MRTGSPGVADGVVDAHAALPVRRTRNRRTTDDGTRRAIRSPDTGPRRPFRPDNMPNASRRRRRPRTVRDYWRRAVLCVAGLYGTLANAYHRMRSPAVVPSTSSGRKSAKNPSATSPVDREKHLWERRTAVE